MSEIRDQWRICSKCAYNYLSRKDQIEALRKRGLDWKYGEPLFSLKPKWLPYVTDPDWLTVERWIDLINRLPSEETLAALSPEEAAEHLGFVNFGIRSYRMVDPDYLIPLLRNVRWTLEAMATQRRPGGIKHFEPDPWILFTTALSLVDPEHVKHCSVCNRLFFARRNDQKACGHQCSNNARQRRFREKHHYNQNRKRNRAAKAAQEERRKESVLRALKEGRK